MKTKEDFLANIDGLSFSVPELNVMIEVADNYFEKIRSTSYSFDGLDIVLLEELLELSIIEVVYSNKHNN